jgi:hypothetical protein
MCYFNENHIIRIKYKAQDGYSHPREYYRNCYFAVATHHPVCGLGSMILSLYSVAQE